jgi:hypothetical protein
MGSESLFGSFAQIKPICLELFIHIIFATTCRLWFPLFRLSKGGSDFSWRLPYIFLSLLFATKDFTSLVHLAIHNIPLLLSSISLPKVALNVLGIYHKKGGRNRRRKETKKESRLLGRYDRA